MLIVQVVVKTKAMFSNRQSLFLSLDQVKQVVKEIVKELGYYTKVADSNRKEYLKAKIRTAMNIVLMKAIDGTAEYSEIQELSEVLGRAETVYCIIFIIVRRDAARCPTRLSSLRNFMLLLSDMAFQEKALLGQRSLQVSCWTLPSVNQEHAR
jgi:hypothetical protein